MTDQITEGYQKEAVATFKKINYMSGLNGHYQFTSANALRNSVHNAGNFDGQTKRFSLQEKGGHVANTYWV